MSNSPNGPSRSLLDPRITRQRIQGPGVPTPAYQTGNAVNEPDAPPSRPPKQPCKQGDPRHPLDKRHAISAVALVGLFDIPTRRLAARQVRAIDANSHAAGGDRTHDLRIKSPLLCQLSYGGSRTMIAHRRGDWGRAGPRPTIRAARPHGLAVRTPAFHAGDRRFESGWGYLSSIPRRVDRALRVRGCLGEPADRRVAPRLRPRVGGQSSALCGASDRQSSCALQG